MDDPVRWASKAEAAQQLEISLSTLDRKIRAGEVEVVREGRRVYERMHGPEYLSDDELERTVIEVTVDESVLRPPEKRRVIHEYGEPLNAEVLVYPLEEIVAEKLRALLQQAAMFEARGWSRSRARDYYDLWRVLDAYGDQMDMVGFDSLLREKCAVRGVSFTGSDDFFQDRMLAFVEETWE